MHEELQYKHSCINLMPFKPDKYFFLLDAKKQKLIIALKRKYMLERNFKFSFCCFY